jgi:hypothetical protein
MRRCESLVGRRKDGWIEVESVEAVREEGEAVEVTQRRRGRERKRKAVERASWDGSFASQ